MSAADDANQRLDVALSRLTTSLQARLTTQDSGAAGAGQAQLEEEMTAVRSEFASLKDTSTVVSQRLDAAIGKIKSVLAE